MNIITGLLQAVAPQSDSDSIDRLSYCGTTVGLVVASAFISGWSFVGQPIQCWFPAYYKGWWQEYALDYCYVQNTYYVPMFEATDVPKTWDIGQHMMPLPVNDTVKERHQIGYYQWVPFILALQALFFYLPIVLWRTFYESAGLKVGTIMSVSSIASNMDEASREKNMRLVSGFITQDHAMNANYRGSLRRVTSGRYIIFLYMAVKLLFALNAIVQFIFLKSVLGVESYWWGLDVTSNLMGGHDWQETGNFPRVTLCDFTVRELGNMHHHTVQCVLMINMFNEKIFLALWYWLGIMFALSIISFLSWATTFLMPSDSINLVKKYIHKIDPEAARSLHKRDLLKEFVEKKLRPDGVFLVRLVESNHGDMVTCALLKTMWQDFKEVRGERPPPYSEPLLLRNKKINEEEL